MSQNNSSNRKSKFSYTPSSEFDSHSQYSPYSNISKPTTPFIHPFKPQPPTTQASQQYFNSAYPPSLPQNNGGNYPGSYQIPGNDQFPIPQNPMHPNEIPFYMQNPAHSYPPPQSQSTLTPQEIQQAQYAFHNLTPQGGFQNPSGYQYPISSQNFAQSDVSNEMGGFTNQLQINKNTESSMVIEKAAERDAMEILPPVSNEEKNKLKRSRLDPRGIHQDHEIIQKKLKTDSKYYERLETLSHELAKIKEFEVQIIKTLYNSPHPNTSNLPTRKQLEQLLAERSNTAYLPFLPQSLIIQAGLLSVPHEGLRNVLVGVLNERLKTAGELEQSKKAFIEQAKKEEEELKVEGRIEEEREPLCKVVYVSTQNFYQESPQAKELEDKMERLEQMLREKNSKIREATKKSEETKVDIELAKVRWEIATQRLKDMEAAKNEKD